MNSTPDSPYWRPPEPSTASGSLRRVGFELEFTGLTLEQAADIVCTVVGGVREARSQAECAVHTSDLGDFNVELDWAFLKARAAAAEVSGEGSEWIAFLRQAAALVVPLEVVCPPIALDRLEVLDALVDALREAGAQGTEDSPLAAYGVHVNAEAPSLDAPRVLACVRAFALLQWWLVERNAVDLSRRITPYIDLYPEPYVERLVAGGPQTRDALFDGYLAHNATRNRALDLLPLLAELDEARVQAVVADPRVNPRPAYHYRLPNCSIERTGWSLSTAWNLWVVVERLAASDSGLAELARDFRSERWPLIGVSRGRWVEHVEEWLRCRGWV